MTTKEINLYQCRLIARMHKQFSPTSDLNAFALAWISKYSKILREKINRREQFKVKA